MQPVGAVFFADRESVAHPAGNDVVVDRGELTVFQTGAHAVVGRSAGKAGGEIGFAGLNQLDRTADIMGAIRSSQNFIKVLLAAETAADQMLVNVDLGFDLHDLGQVGRQSHAGKRLALVAGVDVAFVTHKLRGRVQRFHGGVNHHFCRVFHVQHLVGCLKAFDHIAFKHPVGALAFVLGQGFVLSAQTG